MSASAAPSTHTDHMKHALGLANGLAEQELPEVATLAQRALRSTDATELQELLGRMYRIALGDDCPYLAELADEALRHLELALAS